ncbi:MAG: hypothetical protein IIA87_05215 [Nanoarchaeota archaeon]|nr:hypothetical protein [Nanoarchaeota archaeon]
MKDIYLDQNGWIYLARGWQNGKGEWYEIASKIKKEVDKGNLRVVISLVNILEVRRISNKERREKLINFMMDLSKGYSIFPFNDWVIESEIFILFQNKIGQGNIDIKSRIINQGISNLLGAHPTIQEDVSEEKKEEMIKKVNSVETMRLLLLSERKDLSSSFIKEAERFEEARRKERTMKDKTMQYKVVMANYFRGMIFPKMEIIHKNMNLPNDFLINENMDEKDWINLFQQLPATYSYFSLADRRDRDFNKKIEDNDLYDLFGFTMGVSYCDIFFGEKRFVDFARKSKLDEIYGTIITSSLSELKKAIS